MLEFLVGPILLILTSLFWYLGGTKYIGQKHPWVSNVLFVFGTLSMLLAVVAIVIIGLPPQG